ncbi:MAG: MgtC/SapB family protein [Brumimicrobium sp.]|nr:MgtC/SapB family protein [Brumimicrobium sp.]
MMISWEIILLRLGLAALLGAIIGLERERKHWAAGLRTHMMVCLGSSLIFIVSSYGFFDVISNPSITLDPSRIAAQVVSGIGFLGAGTIIFLRSGLIRGLTTASGLWTVAAIGLAVGAGLYFAAIATTLIAIVILFMLQPIEKKFSQLFMQKYIKIIIEPNQNPAELMNKLMVHKELPISNFNFIKTDTEITIEVRFQEFHLDNILPILMEIQKEEGIREINWNK